MVNHRYLWDIDTRDLLVQARVNDCTVFFSDGTQPRKVGLRIEPWLRAGANRIVVVIGEREDAESPMLDAALFSLPPERHPNRIYELLGFSYSENESPVADDAIVLSHEMRVEHDFGPWCWEGARPFRDQDRDAITDVLTRFHSALEERDTATVHAMLAVKAREVCRALGLARESMDRQLFEAFERCFAAPAWELAPLADVELSPEAQGRLVRVTSDGGGPPILGMAEGHPLALNVSVSCVEGAWVIAR